MAKSASRRGWRQLYRRSRLYVPLAVLVLLALAVYLPLSPPWLARFAEKKARAATGLPISIERLRVRLWTADVDLFGVRLEGGPGQVPFDVGEVRLSGEMHELLAGDGGWPAEVVVESPSVIMFKQSEDGIHPEGALATLLDAIGRMPKKAPSAGGAAAKSPIDGPTPSIILRNVAFYGEPLSGELPPTHVTLYSVEIPARVGAGEPVNARVRGLVTAGGSEEVVATATWQPAAQRLTVRTKASGIGHTFRIPGFGGVSVASEDLDGELVALVRDDGRIEARVKGDFGRFSLEETRINGERWLDDELRLRLNAYYDPKAQAFQEVDFRLESPQIDVRVSGGANLRGAREVDAKLEVARVPAVAFALLRREARTEGIDVDDSTSSTIALDLRARGPLSDPRALSIDGGIDIAGWRLSSAAWPGPIDVHRLRGRVENSILSLTVGDVSFAGVDADVTLSGPLPRPGVEPQPMTATVEASGDAASLFAIAQAYVSLPEELLGVQTPIRVEATATVPVGYGETGVFADPMAEGAQWDGLVAWDAGKVVLRDLPEPVHFEGGRLILTTTEAILSNLRASCAGLQLDVSGRAAAEGASLLHGMPRASVSVVAEGPIPVGMSMASRFANLPFEPDRFGGTLRVSATADGVAGKWDELTWAGRIELQDVSGRFDVPHSSVRFDRLNALLALDRDRIAIERLVVRVEEDATIEANAEVTETGLLLRGKVESAVKVVEHILPKDLSEFVVGGRGRADATVRLVPHDALPPGPDIVRRYVAAYGAPGAFRIGIVPEAPLRLDIDARIFPGEGATFYHREFPHPITNIRGGITADETGFQFQDTIADWGEARDVKVNGYATLGHVGTARIDFDLEAADIDLNDWLEGWGSAPWAEVPFKSTPRVRPPGYQYIAVDGRLKLKKTQFLSVRAENADATLHFESWNDRDNLLELQLAGADVYDGRVLGTGTVWIPRGKGKLSRFQADVNADGVQLQKFMADLLERPAETTGLVTGTAQLGGDIGDYSTWKGTAAFHAGDSNFIGRAAFRRLALALNVGDREKLAPTQVHGTATLADNVVEFPDMVVESEDIQMLAPGRVQIMTSEIDFRLSVNLLETALESVPFVGWVNRTINDLKNRLLAFRVTGTIGDPRVTTEAFTPDREAFFGTGRRALDATTERLKKVEQRFAPRGSAPKETP